MQCSFQAVSSKVCGTVQDRLTVLPIISCNQNINSHLQNFNLSRDQEITGEADLLKYRGGHFESTDIKVICPIHRDEFGVRWRRSVNCMLQWICKGKYKAMKSISICTKQSRFIYKTEKRLVPIGSGCFVKCRSELLQRMGKESEYGLPDHLQSENCDAMPIITMDQASQPLDFHAPSNKEYQDLPMSEVMESSQSTVSTIDSEWCPDSASQDTESSQATSSTLSESPKNKKRKALNEFLLSVGVSPVKKTLSVDWNKASDRTRSDYKQKATQIIKEVLSILAPDQGEQLETDILKKNPEITAEKDILQSIASSYLSTSNWGIQRQMLSIVVQKYSYIELKEIIPDLSRYKFTAARKHAEIQGIGMPVHGEKTHRERASQIQIDHFVQFVTSPGVMTDLPFGTTHYKLTSGEELSAPKIILNTVRTRTVQLYQSYCIETNFSPTLSDRSYMRMLEAIQPAVRKCMKGLDNYAADGGRAFDDLKKIVSTLAENGKGKAWQETIQQQLNNGKQYMKVEYKLHICESSEVPDHCCCFALSDKEDAFTAHCQHQHGQSCSDCVAIIETLRRIEDAAATVHYKSDDQMDECNYMLKQSMKAIHEWKNHILRSVNQDRARKKILENLNIDEALIERDWAMKFLPLQYRESQSKWFAKRGLSWHVSVVTLKSEEESLTSITYIHVFNNTSQDAITSTAILSHTLKEINMYEKRIKNVYVRSDNAGCFHSSYAISIIPALNSTSPVHVKRMDFSDPQGGKGICDRKAAHLKANIRRFVNEGNNVVTAENFKDAIESTTKKVKVFVCLPPETNTKCSKEKKIDEISMLNNFLFDSQHIFFWKQFEVGNGKKLSIKGFPAQIPQLVILSESTLQMPNLVQTQRQHTVPNDQPNASSLIDVVADDNESQLQSANIFSCPDDGCISTFMKYGNLMVHLDIGNHKYVPNIKDIKDRTRILFSSTMESKENMLQECSQIGSNENVDTALKKGWALKSKREVKRFTADQKQFLLEKFNQGEVSGHKCDPDDVSKEMRVVKTSKGNRRFSISEFLTPSQIASYFSRLALKKRQNANSDFQEEDLLAEENDANVELLSNACK